MNKIDMDTLVRWAIDTDKKKFAEDAYGITGTAYDRTDDYISGKFKDMQTRFIMWLGGLSSKNKVRLARNITFNKTEEAKDDPLYGDERAIRKSLNEIGVEATKIIMGKKGE